MKEFITIQKTYIKSNNSIKNINLKYLYSLIFYFITIIITYLIKKDYTFILNLLKTSIITLTITIIISSIINILSSKKKFTSMIYEDNIISISLILSFFLINQNIIYITITIIISLLFKKLIKGSNLYGCIYGILFITLIKYFNNSLITPLTNLKQLNYCDTFSNVVLSNGNIYSYLYGLYYLSPIISIITFIYLFNKKSIKYNIFFSYFITFSLIMLLYGLFKGMNIWYLLFCLSTGNIIFLSIYILTDYVITPVISEGQVIYGLILGMISAILFYIIPELSSIIPLTICPLILTKPINILSIKLKYQKKLYYILISILLIISIFISIILYFIK